MSTRTQQAHWAHGARAVGAVLRSTPVRVMSVTVGLACAVAGCGSQQGAPGSATPSQASGSIAQRAQAFEDARSRGDLAEASKYVLASQRGVMHTPDLPPEMSAAASSMYGGRLTAAVVRQDQADATVVLEGNSCPQGGSSDPRCLENADPNTTDPQDLIHLHRDQGVWWVVFPEQDAPSYVTSSESATNTASN